MQIKHLLLLRFPRLQQWIPTPRGHSCWTGDPFVCLKFQFFSSPVFPLPSPFVLNGLVEACLRCQDFSEIITLRVKGVRSLFLQLV